MTKVCKTCNEEKELEDFHKHKKATDGHKSHCKACVKATYVATTAKEKLANQERWNQYMGANYADARQCVDCKEVKHWTKFCLGADRLVNLCRVCHRVRIGRKLEVLPTDSNAGRRKDKPNNNWEDLMNFLNTR